MNALTDMLTRLPGGSRRLAAARHTRQLRILADDALAISGLSRDQVTATLGWPRTRLDTYLDGTRDLTTRQVAELLHALGWTLDVTITPTGT